MQSWLLVSGFMCDVSESSLDLNLSYRIENMWRTHNILVDARRLPVWSKATPLGWWTHLKIMKRGQRHYLHWVILRGFNPLIASRVPNPIRSGTCGSPGLPVKFFGDLLDKNTSQIHLNTTGNISMSYVSFGKVFHFIHPFWGEGTTSTTKKIWWMNSVKLGFTPKGWWIWSFRHTVDRNHGTGQPSSSQRWSTRGAKNIPKMGNGHSGFVKTSNISILRMVFFSTRICSMDDHTLLEIGNCNVDHDVTRVYTWNIISILTEYSLGVPQPRLYRVWISAIKVGSAF